VPNKYSALIAAFVYTLGSATMAQESPPIELTISATHSIATPWVHTLKHYFVPEFTRRTKLLPNSQTYQWIEIYGGALSKWHNGLEVTEIGLTDVGWVGTLWEPAKMPLQNITYHLPFITDNLGVLVRVYNYIHRVLPAAREAWLKHNQIYLGATGIDTYHLLTKFPVNSLADLKGRKLLAPGPSAVWLQGTGAVPVNGALSTYYTQLKTGVADGTVSILTGAHPYRIHEVAPYITLVGIGAQITGAISINLESWQRLSQAEQEILAELGDDYSEKAAEATTRRYESALATMLTEGATLNRLSPDEKQKWIDGLPEYGEQWVTRHESNGLPAGRMLQLLMDGVREAGIQPQREWDRYE
jgi:TRAP-type C4-dicarboxylate transport system substrate-binding protein